jgi:hypothetical protein
MGRPTIGATTGPWQNFGRRTIAALALGHVLVSPRDPTLLTTSLEHGCVVIRVGGLGAIVCIHTLCIWDPNPEIPTNMSELEIS